MAKRGRKPKRGIARAAAPNLNLRSLKANRKSAGGTMPVHFKQVAFKRDGRAAAGMRKRQHYIERHGAVEPVDLAALEKTGLARSAERFVDAGDDQEAARASFGTLGETPAERRAFWAQIEALERADARVQYGIIAELPHEASQAGRLRIMRNFCAEEIEPRGLPYWATAHRPDAHNDPRNFHVHILYYGRPGRRSDAGWRFDKADTANNAPIEAGKFPWGTEKPSKRIARLENRLEKERDAQKRERLRDQIAEARHIAADRASRTRPADRGGPTNKSQREYPWGVERPNQRKRRLARQMERTTDDVKLTAFRAGIAEVDAYLARPQPVDQKTDLTVRDRDWVAHLRDAWCRACNRVLEKEGHAKRYHPGGYKDLGIDAQPTRKLGTKAAALEAQGIVTAVGRDNTETVLRQLLKAGVDIDAAAATAAAETIGRRAAWATNELAEAERQENAERAAYWRREEDTARRLAAAITERVETTATTESHIIFADRLREILKISSALPVPEEPAATTVSVRADTGVLAAALAARMSPEALADTRDPFAPPPAPIIVQLPETPQTTAPATEAAANPAALPATQTQTTDIEIPSYNREEVVGLLLGREAAVERQQANPPITKALRIRPDITVEERQAIRASLMARKPSELRLSGRHTRNAIANTKNDYERACLETGLQTLNEAYALSMAGAKRQAVARRIALDDAVRDLQERAQTVRILAATLAQDLPQLRERVSATAKTRNSAEDMIAIDGRLALQKLREKSKPANETAERLEAALRSLEEAGCNAKEQGTGNGGYDKAQRIAVHAIRYKIGKDVAWVPPMSDDDRTVRRRVEDSLDTRRLPAIRVPKKFDIKAHIKATIADMERRQQEQKARRIRKAARAQASPDAPGGGTPPGQRAHTHKPAGR